MFQIAELDLCCKRGANCSGRHITSQQVGYLFQFASGSNPIPRWLSSDHVVIDYKSWWAKTGQTNVGFTLLGSGRQHAYLLRWIMLAKRNTEPFGWFTSRTCFLCEEYRPHSVVWKLIFGQTPSLECKARVIYRQQRTFYSFAKANPFPYIVKYCKD